MKKITTRSWVGRALALLLMACVGIAGVLSACMSGGDAKKLAATAGPVKAGLTEPYGKKIVAGLEEPLVATRPPTTRETEEIDVAIEDFRQSSAQPSVDVTESHAPLIAYAEAHPHTAWSAAVQTNLGLAYYRGGYFSRAFTAWTAAWQEGRAATQPQAKALIDRAVGELARMHARVGHEEELKALLTDIGDRPISGSATEMITGAREGAAQMHNKPGEAFLCGSKALVNLLMSRKADLNKIGFIGEVKSGPHGFSFDQVAALADKAELSYRLVHREPGQEIPVPSVVNWKVKHYAAIVSEDNGRFHVKDPTFGGDLLISRNAIDAESSGYFLVPTDAVQDRKWRTVDIVSPEARQVYGMGYTSSSQSGTTVPYGTKINADSGVSAEAPTAAPKCTHGMCGANAHSMAVSLNLTDTPIGYQPQKGPGVFVSLTYNQREDSQPATFGFFNVGPKWTMNTLSYIEDDPTSAGSSVSRYVAGGGSVNYFGYVGSYVPITYSSTTGLFTPEETTQAVLKRVPATGTLTQYELNFPGGGQHIYAAVDGATTSPRRVFLTQIQDAWGNALTFTYDGQLRLTTITDATGRDTTFSYGATDPLLVTGVEDPFGRTVALAYDGSGRLDSITDVIGITSSFSYDGGGLVDAMTTPYGTSSFVFGTNTDPYGNPTTRYLEITDPMNFTERLEYRHEAPGIASRDDEAIIPESAAYPFPSFYYFFYSNNFYTNHERNSYFWDKHVYPTYGTGGGKDYTKALRMHWLHNTSGQTAPIVETVKYPLENPVWFNYLDGYIRATGSIDKPASVARVLDDGTTHLIATDYNVIGKPLTVTDPLGRTLKFTHAVGGVDTTKVERQVSSTPTWVTLAQFGSYTNHQPGTYTDAAGEVTNYAYNADGQLIYSTDALNQTTFREYDGYGRLTRVTVPYAVAFGSVTYGTTNALAATKESYSYDAYDRIGTLTDSEGRAETYSYNALDMLTQVTYPDSTTDIYTYDSTRKLNLNSHTDRLGRTTSYTYDNNQRLLSVTEPITSAPLSRTTSYTYYDNGALHTLTDANGNVTTWDIDVQSRPTVKTFPDSTTETYAYENTTSRLKSVTDALGQIKTYTYNTADELTGIGYTNEVNSTPDVTFAYDTWYPRRTSMVDGIGTTAWSYIAVGTDGALQLQTENGPFASNDSITYTYDALGRESTRTISGGNESLTYDTLGRVATHVNSLGTFTYGYNGSTSQMTTRTLNGTSIGTTWAYDTNTNDRRLTSITNANGLSGTSKPRNYAYTWSGGNPYNVTSVAESNGPWSSQTWSYSYDLSDRLTAATTGSPTSWNFAYTRDKLDNITSLTRSAGSAGGGWTKSANNVNQLTGAGTPTYDAAGEVTDDYKLYRQSWDAEHRMIKAEYKTSWGATTYTSQKTEFKYDGLGRRTVETEYDNTGAFSYEWHFAWCGDEICQVRWSWSEIVARRYFPEGQYALDTGKKHVHMPDMLGSVRDIVNVSTSAVDFSIDHGPDGETIRTNGSVWPDHHFAGMFQAGPYNAIMTRYRILDPFYLTWQSRDPIGEAGGINLYAYTGGNPIMRVDRDGRFFFLVLLGYSVEAALADLAVVGGMGWATHQLEIRHFHTQCLAIVENRRLRSLRWSKSRRVAPLAQNR
ncbi:MAG: RHS repeat-associated core domain-containing protein [Alphaproteobacteria bacterium]